MAWYDASMELRENRSRSALKTASFCLIAVFTDTVVLLNSERVALATTIVVLSNIAEAVLFFVHERLWNGVPWGKKPDAESRPALRLSGQRR